MQHLEGQIGETQSENKAHLKAIQDQVRQAQQHNAQQLDAMQKSIAKTQGAVHVAEQKVREREARRAGRRSSAAGDSGEAHGGHSLSRDFQQSLGVEETATLLAPVKA